MDNPQTHRQRPSSLENALNVLDLFTIDDPEFKIYEIAESLGVANSTAHRLVTTLMSEGFISKDRQTNSYRLGASILALGHAIQSRIKLLDKANPILQKLVEVSQETAHIGILIQQDVVYLSKIECSHPVRLLSYIGKRNPAECTSSGQVLLAYQPRDFLEPILQKVWNPSSFLLRLEEIKKQGFSVSVEELHEGVVSISAPIKNHLGKVIACVTVAGPKQRLSPIAIPRVTRLVVQAAKEISDQVKMMT
ncbi:IclR family transcriptional regulator [Ammoniphilus sp. 3BR4]|uniref:IclR family transcriptional regulator n=1 Tax=Ammoniphilus sp. 3BR4 TaxID=3158265 RepID=UPI0034667984